MTVGLLVGWALVAIAVTWGLLRLLLWDTEGVTPDEALTPSQRQRVEAMRVAEGGLCCCLEHGRAWCVVHDPEGEAVAAGALCDCAFRGQHWCYVHGGQL